jgi:TonB family protein
MATLFCRGWTDGALKNALATCGLTLLLLLALVSHSNAQVANVDRSRRRVVRTSEPDYPTIVKNAHIGGSVRLTVTVLPNGDVAKVDILGGNPIFVASAINAVRKWKYAPAASQTREEVQINFTPD